MFRYILRRILQIIPVFIAVTIITFSLLYMAPGDPVMLIIGEYGTHEQYLELRRQMGLDRPPYVQYIEYLLGVLHGDLGTSLFIKRPALDLILERLPATLMLAFAAILFAVSLAIPLGIISAVKQNTIIDYICEFGAIFGVSMPEFWFGTMLIFLFSVRFGLFPPSGWGGLLGLQYVVLPAIALGTRLMASEARLTRSSMLEVLREDYVRTARSKGLSEWYVIFKHAFRNALIPVVTSIGMQLSSIVGGALIIEVIFAWPGIGRLTFQAIQMYDFPLVQGCFMFITLTFVLMNLIIDILYTYIDPRIKYK